jgi:L-lactate dehydrogenase complex protein LldE
MQVGLFVPCFVDELWPRAARAAVEVMEALGYEPGIGKAACCGQVLANAGDRPGAEAVRAVWASDHRRFETVLVLSASCCGHLRTGAPDRVPVGQTPADEAPRVREFCEWLVECAPAEFPARVDRRLALHPSCSALRETGTAEATREVLRRIPGLEIVDPSRPDECCGFGGTFATEFSELSVEMGASKVRDLLTNGVDGVVSADCSCLLHLAALAPQHVPFFHVAELCREAIA